MPNQQVDLKNLNKQLVKSLFKKLPKTLWQE